MPFSCFSDPAGRPASIPMRRMPTSTSCFRYQPQVPLSMPSTCFRYPPAEPAGIGNRGAIPSALPGLRQMPGSTTCFRY